MRSMAPHSTKPLARKTATNLSVRPELVREARRLKMNLSEIFETALDAAIRTREREAWLATNREAIAEYNTQVENRRLFSDDWRRF
jgi:antitoxin CcdA